MADPTDIVAAPPPSAQAAPVDGLPQPPAEHQPFVPDAANERVLEASTPRNPGMFHILKRFALWLRDHDFHRMLTWAKTNPLIMRVLTRPLGKDKPKMPADTRTRLKALYRPHVEKTAMMIDRDLKDWL